MVDEKNSSLESTVYATDHSFFGRVLDGVKSIGVVAAAYVMLQTSPAHAQEGEGQPDNQAAEEAKENPGGDGNDAQPITFDELPVDDKKWADKHIKKGLDAELTPEYVEKLLFADPLVAGDTKRSNPEVKVHDNDLPFVKAMMDEYHKRYTAQQAAKVAEKPKAGAEQPAGNASDLIIPLDIPPPIADNQAAEEAKENPAGKVQPFDQLSEKKKQWANKTIKKWLKAKQKPENFVKKLFGNPDVAGDGHPKVGNYEKDIPFVQTVITEYNKRYATQQAGKDAAQPVAGDAPLSLVIAAEQDGQPAGAKKPAEKLTATEITTAVNTILQTYIPKLQDGDLTNDLTPEQFVKQVLDAQDNPYKNVAAVRNSAEAVYRTLYASRKADTILDIIDLPIANETPAQAADQDTDAGRGGQQDTQHQTPAQETLDEVLMRLIPYDDVLRFKVKTLHNDYERRGLDASKRTSELGVHPGEVQQAYEQLDKELQEQAAARPALQTPVQLALPRAQQPDAILKDKDDLDLAYKIKLGGFIDNKSREQVQAEMPSSMKSRGTTREPPHPRATSTLGAKSPRHSS